MNTSAWATASSMISIDGRRAIIDEAKPIGDFSSPVTTLTLVFARPADETKRAGVCTRCARSRWHGSSRRRRGWGIFAVVGVDRDAGGEIVRWRRT